MANKFAIITGASTGIGFELATAGGEGGSTICSSSPTSP
jgi:NAD(P)-dependent dehydrogenase (short-subunit alcohol dehydrogenase family)